MGRLIDADAEIIRIMEISDKHSGVSGSKIFSALDVVRILEQAPTAYDIDKVVEQLEETRDELLHSTDYNNDIINYCLDWFDMAIDIVKGAVKDE